MCFKFLVKNQANKTVTIKVEADRERIARQKIARSGYKVLALVGVESTREAELVVLEYSGAHKETLERTKQLAAKRRARQARPMIHNLIRDLGVALGLVS